MFLLFWVVTRQTAILCYDGNTNQCPSEYQTFNEDNFANLDSLIDKTETKANVLFYKSIPDFLKYPLYIARNMEITFSKSDSLSENPSVSISIGSANSESTMKFNNINVNFNALNPSFEDKYTLFFTNSSIYKNDALNLSGSNCYTDAYSYPSVTPLLFKVIRLSGSFNKIYFDTNSSMNAVYIYYGSDELVYIPTSEQALLLYSDQLITISGPQDSKISYYIYFVGAKGFIFENDFDLTLYINDFNGVITNFPKSARISCGTDTSITLEFTNKTVEFTVKKVIVKNNSTLDMTSEAHLSVYYVTLFDSSRLNLFKNVNNTITQIPTEIGELVFANGVFNLTNYTVYYQSTSYDQSNITLTNSSLSNIVVALNYHDYTKVVSEDANSSPTNYQLYPYNMPEDASEYYGKEYPFFCTKYMDCSQLDILKKRFIVVTPNYNEFRTDKGLNFTCDVENGYTCFKYQLTSKTYTQAIIGHKEYRTTSGNIALFVVMGVLSLITIGVSIFIGLKK